MGPESQSPDRRTPGTPGEDAAATSLPSSGRAVTPRDLAALRPVFEECASLSAEAALLAVLVTRLGERERIAIHPADLIEDRSNRLHALEARGELNPKIIGAMLRTLGFTALGRDRRGIKYEIRWEHLWSLDPREVTARRQALNAVSLDGPALLRLLTEE